MTVPPLPDDSATNTRTTAWPTCGGEVVLVHRDPGCQVEIRLTPAEARALAAELIAGSDAVDDADRDHDDEEPLPQDPRYQKHLSRDEHGTHWEGPLCEECGAKYDADTDLDGDAQCCPECAVDNHVCRRCGDHLEQKVNITGTWIVLCPECAAELREQGWDHADIEKVRWFNPNTQHTHFD
jgi:hypothetical protein